MPDNETKCPLRYLIDVFGGKWKLPIVCVLSGDKPQRYSTIKRRLREITNMMLSQSLKELESDGMILRTQFNEVPPHVEYSLTQKGRGAIPVLLAAYEWAINEMKESGIISHCPECMNSI